MTLTRDWWKWLLGVWMTAVIVAAFLYARPVVPDLGETVRILFFHVPCAWIGTLAFLVSAVYSGRYLWKSRPRDDIGAMAAAEIGIVFTFLATVTGAVWAQEIWGKAWNWDPRQTSIFMLLLIYAAYFALRSAVEDPERQARLAAVYSLIAFVTVPFLMFVVPRVIESLHPDPLINRQAKVQMEARLLRVFLSSLLGFTILFFWMLRLRMDILQLRKSVEAKQIID